MAAEELTVQGLTGVDMTLAVAGVGTRAYAFIIDWHIRVLLALAWFLLGWLIARMTGNLLSGGPSYAVGVFAPPLLIYFLYHPVLELVMQGRTPGKRMAGARIVTREGATPGAGALLMRNLFRLVDSLPALYVLGLGFCLFTAQRVRVGDLAAGTVLVIDESQSRAKSLERIGALVQHSSLEPHAAALVEDVLERWEELEPQRREQLACSLLEKVAGKSPELLTGLPDTTLRGMLRELIGRT